MTFSRPIWNVQKTVAVFYGYAVGQDADQAVRAMIFVGKLPACNTVAIFVFRQKHEKFCRKRFELCDLFDSFFYAPNLLFLFANLLSCFQETKAWLCCMQLWLRSLHTENPPHKTARSLNHTLVKTYETIFPCQSCVKWEGAVRT